MNSALCLCYCPANGVERSHDHNGRHHSENGTDYKALSPAFSAQNLGAQVIMYN